MPNLSPKELHSIVRDCFIRCNTLICKILLITLLTSAFAVVAMNSFAYSTIAKESKPMLKMSTSTLDSRLCNESEIPFKSQQHKHEQLKVTSNDSKATQKCCSSLMVLTLFPVTATEQLAKIQVISLDLISKNKTQKTHSFTELIYRPPIV